MRQVAMEQLTAFDAVFLKNERKNTPQHITQIYIYDPSTANREVVRFKDILEHYRERQHLSPLFRKQLLQVPFEADLPYWIESDDVDIEYHIRHLALPKPGDWRQLCILMSRLHSQPIDISRPMWQVYVIEGLDHVEGFPEGAFAILTKMHHAVVDGMAAVKMLEAIHDSSPDGSIVPEPDAVSVDRPSDVELLRKAGRNMLFQPLKSATKMRDIVSSLRQRQRFLNEHREMQLEQNEKTLFNVGVKSPNRVWGAGLFKIADVLAIKSVVPGATLNDVIVCVTSYVVERYLAEHDASIDEPLISAIAVNTREMTKNTRGQNHATVMSVSVHNDIADPVERLSAIHAETVLRKEHLSLHGVDLMSDILEAVPSQILNIGFASAERLNVLDERQTGFHFGSTNLPGPRTPRYMVGAKVVAAFGMSPVMGATGLSFVIGSYCDTLSISFTSAREIVKDPDFLEECIYDAFNRVRSAAKKVQSKAPGRKKAHSSK